MMGRYRLCRLSRNLTTSDSQAENALRRLTIHGISDVRESETTCEKTFWIITVAAFLVFLSIGIYRSVVEYQENPIVTSTSLRPNRTMAFPQVHICPGNHINFSKPNATDIYLSTLRPFYYSYKLPDPGHDTLNGVYDGFGLEYPDVEEHVSMEKLNKMFKSISLETNKFAKTCAFGMDRIANCSTIVKKVISSTHGVCYLIDVNRPQVQKGSGLTIGVDFHADIYPTVQGMSVKQRGAFVQIDKPFEPSSILGVFVSPGRQTRIDLSVGSVRLIEHNYGKTPQQCTRPGDYQFKVLKGAYSSESCEMDCIQNYFLQKCGCIWLYDLEFLQRHHWQTKACDANLVEKCAGYGIERIIRTPEKCHLECYASCEHWTYKYSTTSMEFPSITTHASNDGTNNDMKQLAIIQIAYTSLEYTITTQTEAISLNGFISNIGGLTGIWLGASMLSVLQLAVACCQLLYARLWKRRAMERKQSDVPTANNEGSKLEQVEEKHRESDSG